MYIPISCVDILLWSLVSWILHINKLELYEVL
jgi:hypothetical protein